MTAHGWSTSPVTYVIMARISSTDCGNRASQYIWTRQTSYPLQCVVDLNCGPMRIFFIALSATIQRKISVLTAFITRKKIELRFMNSHQHDIMRNVPQPDWP